MSHHEAGRRFGIDRRTVKKMLSYSAPPGYRRTKPVRRPKLDGFPPVDYGDKLPPSPWDNFTPPRRYIFTPPLTAVRQLRH